MVWFQCPQTKEWELGYKPADLVLCEHGKWDVAEYVHALDSSDAFALLEEAGWWFEYKTGCGYEAVRWGGPGHTLEADSLSELLDKIQEAEEKHATADER